MLLDVSKLEEGFDKIKIGELTDEAISLLNLQRDKCNIVMWEDRFKYIHKHICDFKTKENFDKCVSQIADVIADPDYIAKHPSKNSLEYIKRVDELLIVVVRLKPSGDLALRTVFPLTESQLQDYIKSNTAIKCKN